MGTKRPLPPGVVAIIKIGNRRFPVHRKKHESKRAAIERIRSRHVESGFAEKGDNDVSREGEDPSGSSHS